MARTSGVGHTSLFLSNSKADLPPSQHGSYGKQPKNGIIRKNFSALRGIYSGMTLWNAAQQGLDSSLGNNRCSKAQQGLHSSLGNNTAFRAKGALVRKSPLAKQKGKKSFTAQQGNSFNSSKTLPSA